MLNPFREDDVLEDINVSFEAAVITGLHADKKEDGDEKDDCGELFNFVEQLKVVAVITSLLEQQGEMSGDEKRSF